MGTVTIAATYGCGGSIIGPAVAKKLALPFVDRAIPPALAAKIHQPLVAALADDAEEKSAAGRLLNSALGYTGCSPACHEASRSLVSAPTSPRRRRPFDIPRMRAEP